MKTNYINHLERILKEGNVSQSQLASQLDVTFAALNRWVNGHAIPRPSKIIAINKIFREVVGYPSITQKEMADKIKEASWMKNKRLWNFIARDINLQDELLLEHTYNSTSIEGTTFTKREAESVIFNKVVIPDKSLIEHLEVTNLVSTLRRIFMKDFFGGPISETFIKELHKGVMTGIRDDAGHYSRHQRAIRGVNVHLTHPDDIPEEISNLLKSWNSHQKITVKEIAEFHSSFELIHPFGDGNGRVGRLLLVLQCLNEGYPPVVIENSRKADYYDVLEYAQRKSERPFVFFLVDEMIKTKALIDKYAF
jgi:Fic family protein